MPTVGLSKGAPRTKATPMGPESSIHHWCQVNRLSRNSCDRGVASASTTPRRPTNTTSVDRPVMKLTAPARVVVRRKVDSCRFTVACSGRQPPPSTEMTMYRTVRGCREEVVPTPFQSTSPRAPTVQPASRQMIPATCTPVMMRRGMPMNPTWSITTEHTSCPVTAVPEASVYPILFVHPMRQPRAKQPRAPPVKCHQRCGLSGRAGAPVH
mmetsp:Transcript_83133/g.146591  ORF Transcript_83133/g.146591 Transcript_83133/m.146591 type:complete len:211 (+) Transcript_83133:194-826(+)